MRPILAAAASIWLFSFAATAPSWADDGNVAKTTRYLALGDSIAFGFNPTVPIDLENYHGYPQFVAAEVHRRLANASCFGETSGSFLSPTAPDFGCRAWKQAGHPLFVA